ncbi:bifunctional lytic transglycosylase/C40 family peptidase [Rhodococcus sp. HNM0569]|uniref:C40 family peptidase n=1 Tax=Rhodococcus sp. HNM0569 TaxID=2716340 RepID=UPI00146F37F6|nr:bifunctional lytic transglycosylase/C40 family peptidase [Rhodococcus sp. HNM0569]NLU82775.1 lytic transglycosylase [Rhodococcus sp. HNM0569]
MSVDAAAIIVAITTAAGAILQGADVPQQIKDEAAKAVDSVQNAAPEVQSQVDGALAGLPEGTRQQAESMLGRAGDAVQEGVAPWVPPEAGVPDAPKPGLDGVPFEPEPVLDQPPPAAAGTSTAAAGAGSVSGALPGAPILGGLGNLVPPVAATFPGVSLAPIGAVAVFAPWLRKAGSICSEITPETIASLYSVTSGFRYGAAAPTSLVGARGPGQFLPATWSKYGKDADGDGKADILGVADSVMASGNVLCDTYQQVEQWKREGAVRGDSLDLTLAAYGVTPELVRLAGGVPTGRGDSRQQDTQPFVTRVRSLTESFSRMLSPFFYGTSGFADSKVVDAAMRFIGLPYVWGGGGINGPTMGGFDCSGLTSYAVHAASGISLPRTSEQQWKVGVEVPLDQMKPGDLLFGNWGGGGPGHVAIYVGNGQMLHAPTTGDVVRIGPIFEGMKARRLF